MTTSAASSVAAPSGSNWTYTGAHAPNLATRPSAGPAAGSPTDTDVILIVSLAPADAAQASARAAASVRPVVAAVGMNRLGFLLALSRGGRGRPRFAAG